VTADSKPSHRRVRSIVHRRADGDGTLELDRSALKDAALVVVPGVLLVVASFWLASAFIRPAPPTSFLMSTGPQGGAYHLFAQRYRDIVARDGIAMELRPSLGSLENLERLNDAGSGVHAALVQAGIGAGAEFPELRSLGAVFYEPLWIFYRGAREATSLNELVDRRIAIGPEGSGSRALALQLLRAVGAAETQPNMLPLGGAEAAEALAQGRVDAVVVVGAPDAPVVQRLINAEGVRLLSLANAEAFARRFPHLTALRLPAGVLDLAARIPPQEVSLLATTATLVVRADFHPALAFLLLQAAATVHSSSGVLQHHREFPSVRESEFALSEDAVRYLQQGPPFLRRYLPFWLANLIERMIVLLLPLFAVLVPAVKVVPALLQWRAKSRVFRWYGEVKYLEQELARHPDAAHAPGLLERLDEIERGVARTSIPNAYSDYAYNLRTHLDVVRNRILRLTGSDPAAKELSHPEAISGSGPPRVVT
jgi:TRAP-type uncharacterized transport system substrate-binding protein